MKISYNFWLDVSRCVCFYKLQPRDDKITVQLRTNPTSRSESEGESSDNPTPEPKRDEPNHLKSPVALNILSLKVTFTFRIS